MINTTLIRLRGFFVLLFMFSTSMLWSQGPALEFATGDGNPAGNGPVESTTIRFRNNTNNPGGNTFATYTPALNVTFALSLQQYNFAGIANNAAVVMGYANGTSPIYPALNAFGAPIDSYFTSSDNAASQGISVSSNNSVEYQIISTPLRVANIATNLRVRMADLTLTFNRPVNNPVLHFAGLGGSSGGTAFTGEFDLQNSNVPVTLTRLSGSTPFVVTGTQINHGQASPGGTGADAASGSVRFNGTGITTITLRVFLRGNGAGNWSTDTTAAAGDAFQISVSLLESDLAISGNVSNPTPTVGDNVTFNFTASNNGASNNTGINVAALLPSGYSFVSATPSFGTYDDATGIWSIGAGPAGASATLAIVATVNPAGSYNYTASISGDLQDPTPANNSVSLSTTPAPLSDLVMSKTASDLSPVIGTQINFLLSVTNNGPSIANSVSVLDQLPNGYVYVGDDTGDYNNGTGIWSVGNLNVGQTALINITVLVLDTGNYTNTASASSNSVEANAVTATSTVTPVPVPSVDMEVNYSVSDSSPSAGDTITFTINLDNNGSGNATGVSVYHALPNGYTYVSHTGDGTYNSTTGIWTVGNMNNGVSRSIQVVATVNPTGQYQTFASVSLNQADPDYSNNYDESSVEPLCDLRNISPKTN